MTNYEETKFIIAKVLEVNREDATKVLHTELLARGLRAPEFYDGVIMHGTSLPFNPQQWFNFHTKIPHWRLLEHKPLMDKLSENQRAELFKLIAAP